ncbi:hypothetical protein KR51_00036460 [Rubidibacter lacunae KORDI 51-2]|uniref:CHAT domain-containing protein n=1 Tax=Rubidibacter lacunae KORDI 51-2 TaxID=582515 RepID=U5DH31_9CHRO|nr:CHAT domain-containing protein [Rubidibacter lacunae]ERN39864.1 hypothetical protein KR51_00036460 [Rubidibacter lacunae KORDI 51-2]
MPEQYLRLKLRQANGDRYRATLTASHRPEKELEGCLYALPPELLQALRDCQHLYRQLDDARIVGLSVARGNRDWLLDNLRSALDGLEAQLNGWLERGSSSGWQTVRDGLIAYAGELHRKESDGEIFILLDCKDDPLNRLPWQAWRLLATHYPHSEVVLQAPKDSPTFVEPQLPATGPRVLVVVGRGDGIDTKADLAVVRELEARGAEVRSLIQPRHQELCEALWDECGYHIFVFTGHSGSRSDGRLGWLELDCDERLSVEDLRDSLAAAIHNGLQLAIFNSCDGLGLAYQLAQINLPQSIVMREPVPDTVAVDFLRYFFREFARDRSLLASIFTARKRLEPHQDRYPGATLLPTLCLKPSAEFLTWQRMQCEPTRPARPWQTRVVTLPIAIAIGLTGVAIGAIGTLWLLPPPCTASAGHAIACAPPSQELGQ